MKVPEDKQMQTFAPQNEVSKFLNRHIFLASPDLCLQELEVV